MKDRNGLGMKHESRRETYSSDYGESMEEIENSSRDNHNGKIAQDILSKMRQRAKQDANVHEFIKIEEEHNTTFHKPDSAGTALGFFQHASLQHTEHFAIEGGQIPHTDYMLSSSKAPDHCTKSIVSMTSAGNIADMSINPSRTDTGVALKGISQYIFKDEDDKWACLFEGCGKKVCREESIKSHVQIHLDSRPYRCSICLKSFVHQHHLKRHAKIHLSIKPYPCECGSGFVRQDALTKHRQRGMCIGAFDGVLRKVVHSGRLRRGRSDMQIRAESFSKTIETDKMSISSVVHSLGIPTASISPIVQSP